MVITPDEKTELTYHFRFYEIAYYNYLKAKELIEELDKAAEKQIEKTKAINRHIFVTVIFSALTLEAYINHYGRAKLSKTYCKNYLDKLSTVSKWVIIPRLVTGNQISTDCQSFEYLKWLFKLRDTIVHSKSKIVPLCHLWNEYLIKEDYDEKSIKTVRKIIEELSEIDNKIDVKWIDIIENNISADSIKM